MLTGLWFLAVDEPPRRELPREAQLQYVVRRANALEYNAHHNPSCTQTSGCGAGEWNAALWGDTQHIDTFDWAKERKAVMRTIGATVLVVTITVLTIACPGKTLTEGTSGYEVFSEASAGGLVDALGRVVLGGYIDRQECNAVQTARGYNYQIKQGAMVKVEEVKVQPEVVEPGRPSLLVMTYAVLNSNPSASAQVSERRQIINGQQILKEIGPMVVNRIPGTYYSEQAVTFPRGLPEGRYALKGVVEAFGKMSFLETHFQVTWVPSDSGYAYLVKKADILCRECY